MDKYERQFNMAIAPLYSELQGKWQVSILSGSIPNMRRLGHVKVIREANGYNRTLGFIRWGKFRIGFSDRFATFQYDKLDLFDRVKKMSDGLMIGQYYFKYNPGLPELGGYFAMSRK